MYGPYYYKNKETGDTYLASRPINVQTIDMDQPAKYVFVTKVVIFKRSVPDIPDQEFPVSIQGPVPVTLEDFDANFDRIEGIQVRYVI